MSKESFISRPARILVVDDERHIARLMEYVLKKECYQVRVATSGEQALEMIERFEPDGLLLDLVMPGLSGLDVLKRVRANHHHDHVKIGILTARSFEGMSSEVSEAGASFHCVKPAAPTTLIKKLLDSGVAPLISNRAEVA